MLNSITACDLAIAASCPAESAACSFCAVMSVANLTTLYGRPWRSSTGLYEAWIQISRWPLPKRRYCPASYSPRPKRAQKSRYSALRASSGSTNRE